MWVLLFILIVIMCTCLGTINMMGHNTHLNLVLIIIGVHQKLFLTYKISYI